MAAVGLSDRFVPLAISGELGVGKPDPQAYLHVTDALGVRPDRVVMVGDSWERDVVGARAAGLGAVWVSAGRSLPAEADAVPGGPGAVAVIRTVAELPGVLAAT